MDESLVGVVKLAIGGTEYRDNGNPTTLRFAIDGVFGRGLGIVLTDTLLEKAARAAIAAHLSALEAKGMVVVPKDATVAMVVAGCNALGNNAARGEIMAAMLSREVHALALTKMRLRFAAMLAAAKEQK